MSPFVRGWKLDEIGDDRRIVADILLRWVVSQDLVDRAIVSMRRADWDEPNLASERRGLLSPDEKTMLKSWVEHLG